MQERETWEYQDKKKNKTTKHVLQELVGFMLVTKLIINTTIITYPYNYTKKSLIDVILDNLSLFCVWHNHPVQRYSVTL